MNRSIYRPSGQLRWMLRHIPLAQPWSFVGCLGTEARSLAAWKLLRQCSIVGRQCLVRIADKTSYHSPLTAQRLAERRVEFVTAGGDESVIRDISLFCPHYEIIQIIDEAVESAQGALVIDITSLPKRFFFPIIRRALD